MSTWRRHRAHRNSRASSSPRRGGLDDLRLPSITALGAVRKCGSGRSLGHDRQISGVRGCVGLLADSDLTATPERRHRRGTRRRRPVTGNISSGGEQRHAHRRAQGRSRARSAPTRQRQLTRASTQPPTPRYAYDRIKPGESPEEQLRLELDRQGYDTTGVTIRVADQSAEWARVHRPRRSRDDPTNTERRGYHALLTFDAPVRGPISLGHSSHFGLGLFVPMNE